MAAFFSSMAANGSGCHLEISVAISPRRNVHQFPRIADHDSCRGDLDRESGKGESAKA